MRSGPNHSLPVNRPRLNYDRGSYGSAIVAASLDNAQPYRIGRLTFYGVAADPTDGNIGPLSSIFVPDTAGTRQIGGLDSVAGDGFWEPRARSVRCGAFVSATTRSPRFWAAGRSCLPFSRTLQSTRRVVTGPAGTSRRGPGGHRDGAAAPVPPRAGPTGRCPTTRPPRRAGSRCRSRWRR
jgi:hypothetical protein